MFSCKAELDSSDIMANEDNTGIDIIQCSIYCVGVFIVVINNNCHIFVLLTNRVKLKTELLKFFSNYVTRPVTDPEQTRNGR